MSTASSRVFDELAKLMTNAAGAAQGVRREIDTLVKTQLERALGDMQIVSREEFQAVKEMASKARLENESLAARIAELESAAAKPANKPVKKPAKRPAAKK